MAEGAHGAMQAADDAGAGIGQRAVEVEQDAGLGQGCSLSARGGAGR